MYIPTYYKEEDLAVIKALVAANPFGIVVSNTNNRLWATHLPMALEEVNGDFKLNGHISKANKQGQTFTDGEEVMAIFQGAHSYVSPSWYDHENVPTWNYQAVHLYGTVRIIKGDELKAKLGKMIDKYEQGMKKPIHIDKLPEGMVDNEMRGIIGFEISVTEIQAASKLSQNRDAKNYHAVIEGLTEKGDPDSLKMAEQMKRRK